MTPGTVTPIIDKLIADNFLQRERNEEVDRRKVFIYLDKKGKGIYDKHLESKLKVAKVMMKNFNKDEKDQTIEVMKKVSENLSKND